jgi:hypothetical protein
MDTMYPLYPSLPTKSPVFVNRPAAAADNMSVVELYVMGLLARVVDADHRGIVEVVPPPPTPPPLLPPPEDTIQALTGLAYVMLNELH